MVRGALRAHAERLLAAAVVCAPAVAFAQPPPDPPEEEVAEPPADAPPIEVDAGATEGEASVPDPDAGASEAGSPRPAPPEPGESPVEGAPPVEEGDPTEVTVAGTRVRQTSGSAHVLRSEQLERFEKDDPHSVLIGVPGVYVRGEDGQGLRPNIGIRGAISDRSKKVTLMEDGVLFGPAPYSAPAAYYFPLMTRMQSVRLIKGPSAISYGPHTVGGALDLVTASIPGSPSGLVDVGLGEYGYRKVHLRHGVSLDQLGALIEGVHLANDGFKRLDGGGDTGFVRNEWMGKVSYLFLPATPVAHELELKLGYSDETSYETYLGLTDEDFRETPYRRYGASRNDRMDWTRTQVQLQHRMHLAPKVLATTTAYRHDFSRIWNKVNGFRGASLPGVLTDPTSPTNAIFYGVLAGEIPPSTDQESLLIGPNNRDFVSQGVQTVVTQEIETGPISHRLEYGYRIHYDSIRRIHTERGFAVEGTGLVDLGEPEETTARNSAETYALALHATDAATWGPVTVTPGVRVETIRGEAEDELTGVTEVLVQQVVLPGVGAYVALPHDFGVLAGVHQGFSPVPPGGSSTPQPEKSVNYEVGARWAPRKVRVEWIGFYNDYENLSDICTFSSGCLDENLDRQFDAGSARVFGFEAFAESELSVTKEIKLPGRVAYTYTNAEFANDFTSADPIFGDVTAGDELPYVPEHQLGAAMGVEVVGVGGLHLGASYVDAMREVAGQGPAAPGTETDAAFLVDLSVAATPLSWLTIYGTVDNLLDEAHLVSRRPFGARPGAPRWFHLGTKLRY